MIGACERNIIKKRSKSMKRWMKVDRIEVHVHAIIIFISECKSYHRSLLNFISLFFPKL